MHLRALIPSFCAALVVTAIMPVLAAPIHQAVRDGDLSAVEQLIDDGANIDAKDPLGTALHHAVTAGHIEIVDFLLARSANANAMSGIGSPLHLAILTDRRPIAGTLIAAGTDVNATVGEGNTPLHYAAQSGNSAPASQKLNIMSDRAKQALGFVTSKTQYGEAGIAIQSRFGAGASSGTRLLVRVLVGVGRLSSHRQ